MTYSKVISDIEEAVRYIKAGRAVAFPTGTSYGLAVDALQGWALQRLRNLKGRPAEKTFTVFLSEALWGKYLGLTTIEQRVINELTNSPLTLLVKPKAALEHLAQDGLIGLRIIDHPIMRKLAEAAQVPLTATSANISGQAVCWTTECITKQFPGQINAGLLNLAPEQAEDVRVTEDTTYDLSLAAILDGGEMPHSEPSTLARIVDNHVEIVRQGALSREAIEAALKSCI